MRSTIIYRDSQECRGEPEIVISLDTEEFCRAAKVSIIYPGGQAVLKNRYGNVGLTVEEGKNEA